jgi:hypothetical protein
VTAQHLYVQLVGSENQSPKFGTALLVSRSNDSLIAEGCIHGEFRFTNIQPGIYKLYVRGLKAYQDPPVKIVRIKSKETYRIELQVNNCPLDYAIHACPVGGSTRKVIRVDYSARSNAEFTNTAEDYHSLKELERQGYYTYMKNEQEVLLYVHDEQQNQILKSSTACDEYLFCKKHKMTFRMK